jgi:anti-sigma factor ChrR (cupin superfamily)
MKTSSKRAGAVPANSSRPDDAPFAGAQSAVLEALLINLAPAKLKPAHSAALKERILAKAAALAPKAKPARKPAIVTIPASDEGWFEALPKIHIKQVYTDGTAESYLVRLEPGARAPAHGHPGDEECVVLEGSVRYVGGSTLNAGDFEAVYEGAQHSELVSDTGALVYLRYSQPLAGYLKL